MRLEEAQQLGGVPGVSPEDARPGLSEHPPDEPGGLAQLLREPLHRELGDPDRAHAPGGDLVGGGLGLSDHRPGAAHEFAVERAHPKLDRFLFRLPAQLRDREDAAGDTPRPITESHHAVRRRGAQPFQRPGQYAHAIREERAVGGVVDIRLHDRGVHPQSPAPDDPTLARQGHQAFDQPLEDVRAQAVAEPDERLRVGHPLAVDAAERPVHQTAADLPLALVEGPVEQVLQDQHPEDDLRRRPEATPAPALAVPSAQRLDHLIHQPVIREHRVDRPERGVPELVAVGEQHLNQATLDERASDHLPSAEAVGPWHEEAATPRAAGDSTRPAPATAPGAPATRPRRSGPAGPGPAARSTQRWSRPTPESSHRDGGRASGRSGSGIRSARSCGRSRRGCQRSPGGPGAGGGGAGRRVALEWT